MEAHPHITLEVTFQDIINGEDVSLKGYFIFEVKNHTITVRETTIPSKTKEFEEDNGVRGFKICTNVEGNQGVTKCLLCPCLLSKAQTQQDLLDRKQQDARTLQCPCCMYGDLSKHSEYKEPRSTCQCDARKRDPSELSEKIDKLLKETYELELELEINGKEPSDLLEEIFQEAPKSQFPYGCAHADVERLPENIDILSRPTYEAPKSKCPCGCAHADVEKLPENIDILSRPTYGAPKSKCPCGCAHADVEKLPENIDILSRPTYEAPKSKCPCGARAVATELPEETGRLPQPTYAVRPGETRYKQATAPPADLHQEDPNQVDCLCPECSQIVQGASPREIYPDDAQSQGRLYLRDSIISTSLEEQTFLGPNKCPTQERSQQQTPKKQQSSQLVIKKQQTKQQIPGKQPSQQHTSTKQQPQQQTPVEQQSKPQIPEKQPSLHQTTVKQQSKQQIPGKQASQQQTPMKQQPQQQTTVKQQSKPQIPGKQQSQQQTTVKQQSKQQIPGKQPSQQQTPVKQQLKQQIPGKQPSHQQTPVKQQLKQQIPGKQPSQQQPQQQTPVKQQPKQQIPGKQPSQQQTTVKQQSKQQIPGKQPSQQQTPTKQQSQHQTPMKQQSKQQAPVNPPQKQQIPGKHQFMTSPRQTGSPLVDAKSQEIFTTPQQTAQPIPRYVQQTPLHTPPETPQEADRAFIASPTQSESPQTGVQFQTLDSVLSTSVEEEQPSLQLNRDPLSTSTPSQARQPSLGRESLQSPQEADRAFIATPTQIESPQTDASKRNCKCAECSYDRPGRKVTFADSEYHELPSQLAEHHLDLHDINLSRPEQTIDTWEPISSRTDRKEEAGPTDQTPPNAETPPIVSSPQPETPPTAERGFIASPNQLESPQQGVQFQALDSVLSTSVEEEQPSLQLNRDPLSTSTPSQARQPPLERESRQSPQTGVQFQALDSVLSTSVEEEQPSLQLNRDPLSTSTPSQARQPSLGRESRQSPQGADRTFIATPTQIGSPQTAEFDDQNLPPEFTKPLATSTPTRLSLQTGGEDDLGPIQQIPELPETSNKVDQTEPQGAEGRNEQFLDFVLYDLINEVYDLHRLNQQTYVKESKQGSFHEESEVGPLKALQELENQKMNELQKHAEKLYSVRYKKEELDSFKNLLEKDKSDPRKGSNINHILDDSNFQDYINEKLRDLQDKRSDEQRASKSPSENGAGFPRNNSKPSRRKSSWIQKSSDFLRDSANSLKLKLGFHRSVNTQRNEVNRRARLHFVSLTSDSTFSSGFLIYISNLFHEIFVFIFHLQL